MQWSIAVLRLRETVIDPATVTVGIETVWHAERQDMCMFISCSHRIVPDGIGGWGVDLTPQASDNFYSPINTSLGRRNWMTVRQLSYRVRQVNTLITLLLHKLGARHYRQFLFDWAFHNRHAAQCFWAIAATDMPPGLRLISRSI